MSITEARPLQSTFPNTGIPKCRQMTCRTPKTNTHSSPLNGVHRLAKKNHRKMKAQRCPSHLLTGFNSVFVEQNTGQFQGFHINFNVKLGNLSVSSVTSSVTVCVLLAVLWSSLWYAQQRRTRFTRAGSGWRDTAPPPSPLCRDLPNGPRPQVPASQQFVHTSKFQRHSESDLCQSHEANLLRQCPPAVFSRHKRLLHPFHFVPGHILCLVHLKVYLTRLATASRISLLHLADRVHPHHIKCFCILARHRHSHNIFLRTRQR